MDDLKVMIQDVLKHVLAGLIPLLATEMTPVATTILLTPTVALALAVALAPDMETPLAYNDNVRR